ncbi:MAG: SET domain-containing protein-lysine N-methyltransferase [Polyangiaceae bacterium]
MTSRPSSSAASPLFVVRGSSIQGKGVFAARPIRRGARIVEYTGERITHEEAEARYDDRSMARHHTFLFTVDEEICIDGNAKTNVARFINHSCDPNCHALDVRGRIFIFAKRAIPVGEELSYDYGYELEISPRMAKKYYPCRCGSANCRGTIVTLPEQPTRKANAKKKSAKKASAKKTSRKSATKGKKTKR